MNILHQYGFSVRINEHPWIHPWIYIYIYNDWEYIHVCIYIYIIYIIELCFFGCLALGPDTPLLPTPHEQPYPLLN